MTFPDQTCSRLTMMRVITEENKCEIIMHEFDDN